VRTAMSSSRPVSAANRRSLLCRGCAAQCCGCAAVACGGGASAAEGRSAATAAAASRRQHAEGPPLCCLSNLRQKRGRDSRAISHQQHMPWNIRL
jgi:hypothetical protein